MELPEKEVRTISKSARQALLKRWRKKQDFVDALKGGITYSSSKPPFYLYFNALHLDHMITNRILPNDKKDLAAVAFRDALSDDSQRFLAYFRKKAANYATYAESWQKIAIENEWQHSRSNISFMLDEILNLEKSTVVENEGDV